MVKPGLTEEGWERIKWACLILFVIATFFFILFITNWDIRSSQHVWCDVIDKINTAPAAQHAYGQALAKDFKELQGQLGC